MWVTVSVVEPERRESRNLFYFKGYGMLTIVYYRDPNSGPAVPDVTPLPPGTLRMPVCQGCWSAGAAYPEIISPMALTLQLQRFRTNYEVFSISRRG
jgi:hypothetical protein